ncbi:MAG: hypothetical protein KKG95_07960 [Candidatus Omnitrophica bacterium]|nr:hypothetical protein [Candidatus Omnitrophota bacterium]
MIQHTSSTENIDWTDAQTDAEGDKYVYVRGLVDDECEACASGRCVQKVIDAGGGYVVVHEPESLN